MKKWLLAALLLASPAVAVAQSVPGPAIQTGVCGALGGPLCTVWTAAQWVAAWQAKVDVQGGTLNTPTVTGGIFNSLTSLGVTGTTTFSGLATFNAAGTALTLPAGSNASIGGTLGVTSGVTLTNPVSSPALTLSGNSAALSNTNLCAYICQNSFVGGTTTTNFNAYSLTLNDKVASTTSGVGFNILHNVGPNNNVATGTRVALNVAIVQPQGGAQFTGTIVGTALTFPSATGTVAANQTLSGLGVTHGTTIVSGSGLSWVVSASQSVGPVAMQTTQYAYNGEDSAITPTGFMQNNLGGWAGYHQGALTVFNPTCQVYATATYVSGCVDAEWDMGAYAGTQNFSQNIMALYVLTRNDQTEGQLGPSLGMVFAQQGHTDAPGFTTLFQLGSTGSQFPMSSFGRVIAVEPSNDRGLYPTVTGSFIDAALMTYHGYTTRQPFTETVALQAQGITSATRLTTDGLAANGYIADAVVVTASSGYVTEPTWTVTGCTGAVVNSAINSVGAVAEVGVYTPGTGCIAESTVAVSSGAATAALEITGNTLNLPINSTNTIHCVVNAWDTAGDGIAWVGTTGTSPVLEYFVATMGATSSTTVVLPTVSWTQISATTNGAANLGISVPTADTSLGAINITGTPTTASFTGSISGTALTVSGVTGTIVAGQTLSYSGAPGSLTIVSGSGTSWVISANEGTVGSRAMTTAVTASYGGECTITSSAQVI